MSRWVRAGAWMMFCQLMLPVWRVAIALAGHAPVRDGGGVTPAVTVTVASEAGVSADQWQTNDASGRRSSVLPRIIPAVPRARSGKRRVPRIATRSATTPCLTLRSQAT